MTDETRQIVRYRFERAQEALEDARLLLLQDRVNGAMNRVYYAMFYSAAALLATKNLSSARHSGVIALFSNNFVKTGEFPQELARQLGIAFDARSSTDYRDMLVPDRLLVQSLFESAKDFVLRAGELADHLTRN
jgi:uncharacterized protein (UPF0332 family)